MNNEIKTLQLENYRNYEAVTLNCHPEVNILIGENAQGKTNLLESIYTLALKATVLQMTKSLYVLKLSMLK